MTYYRCDVPERADLEAEMERLRSGLRDVSLMLDNARYAEAREEVIRLLA